ncbi:hybrid cluster protein-associated redox disulfide domain-containing protein [Eubacterium ruminantium]|nr:hybrid cluster protein-associated redox disulfide domain-containing protein [Eubacterium ruminantium]
MDEIKDKDAAIEEVILEEDKKKLVTKDMNIHYILKLHPESSVILMSIGMGCISCFAAEFETLAEACVVHGLDADDVTEYLNGELGLLPNEE